MQYQLVSDAHMPLLRTIPFTGQNGDVIVNSLDNVHYIGFGQSTFQEIEMHISDDTGFQVLFEYRHVIIKLHFHKK